MNIILKRLGENLKSSITTHYLRFRKSLSAAYQVARSQKKPDEDDLRETRRNIRSKIAELLEDYRAELD